MARFKSNEEDQGMFLPINLKKQLIPGTFEHTSNLVIDKIDLSVIESKYKNDETGAKAYAPRLLLKIIINAYAKGMISSRKIEELCKENIIFIAMAGDLHPDHSTIASFVTSMEKEIIDIFKNVLIICAQCDLIGGEVFALDGCKLSSNAGKEWSGTFKELENKKLKLEKTLKLLIEKHKRADTDEEKKRAKKSKENIKTKIEKITEYILKNEAKPGTRGRENKSNITDNQSAKMHSPRGIIQGYNGMSLVDNKKQIVVHADVYGNVSESEYLNTIMEQGLINLKECKRKNFSFKKKQLLADTNYFSETNCEYIFTNKIDGYIPDTGFRKRDPRFPEKKEESKRIKKYQQQDFKYNHEQNCYYCPLGKTLHLKRKNILFHGYRGDRYEASTTDCKVCVMQYKCLNRQAKKRSLFIIREKKNKTYSQKMIEKIDTVKGRDIYMQRMGIVEPVFANITYHKRMNRFHLRGRNKVKIQWLLYNIVHNIEKIAKYGKLNKLKIA